VRHGVQLIAYADRFGGDLHGLRAILEGPFDGVFTGVHLLPFYRPFDGADAGFDPEDHLEVDARLGTWSDVAALGRNGEVMADLIVNHVSVRSPQFEDFINFGDASNHAAMFLTMSSVFPVGATEHDLTRIYRPRVGLPFTPYLVRGSERRLIWTTFTERQADIDVAQPESVAYLQAILQLMAANGVTAVRLDAVGYAVKRPGTSCFMLPETFTFISSLSRLAKDLGIDVLVEIHSHYGTQLEISRQVDYTYDFALPPLMLHALFTHDLAPLVVWLGVRPPNVVSVLDTHDGIGVVDVGADRAGDGGPGLLDDGQIDALVAAIHRNTDGASELATGAAASNLDLYQVNSTFYDALGRNEDRYLLARAVQFYLPGVPQVYYVGLLGGANDVELLARTGVGRDVNRHHYTASEIETACETSVVQRLLSLIRFRNRHPAFDGEFSWEQRSPAVIAFRWQHHEHATELVANFDEGTFEHVSTGIDAGA